MKSKFYKYGVAALVGVSALALAGCQSNENQSSTSNANGKSKSSIVKIEKKSKSKSSKSEKQEGEVRKQSSENLNKASSAKKDVEKVPTATELMNNVSAFNEGNFDIRLNYATVKGYDTGIIQENPRVVHYKFNGGSPLTVRHCDSSFFRSTTLSTVYRVINGLKLGKLIRLEDSIR